MDTADWTVEQHIEWIRNYAEDSRVLASQVLGWQLDNLGTHAGTVEVIDWPEDDDFIKRHRPWNKKPDGSRVMFHGGCAYLVRDVVR